MFKIDSTFFDSKFLALFSFVLLSFFLAFEVEAQQPVKKKTDSRELVLEEPVKELPSNAKRWALVIGVDNYQDKQIGALRGAANDAKSLASALVNYAGFPKDQVILMATDQPDERQPTRVNLLRRLSNLATLVPKDGLLLISFAGHGMERNGQAFLLPSDAQISDDISFLEETAISLSRIKDRIKTTGVGQVLFLLDACRNDPGGRADASNNLTTAYTSAFNFDVKNKEITAFATLYATAIGQRAYEYSEKKQGYFTWALVEGLKGLAANEKGEITLAGLVRFVQETVPKRVSVDLGAGKQQKPFAIIEGYRAEDLVIAVASPDNNKTSETAITESPKEIMPAADEVLEKYFKAIGGKQAAENLKTIYRTGSYESIVSSQKVTGTVIYAWKAPSKFFTEIKLSNGNYSQQGFDGEIGWLKSKSGVTQMTGWQLEFTKRNAELTQIASIDRFKALYPKYIIKGVEKAGEKETIVIEATPVIGKPELLYFDTKTWFLTRWDVFYESSGQKGVFVPIQLYAEEYIEVNGMMLPFVFRQVSSGYIATTTLFSYGIKFNEPIEDKIFTMPKK